MKIKDGAVIAGLDIRMRPALLVADKIWKSYGKELTVTCGLDGEHSAGSLHYYGLALDLRTREFSDADKLQVASSLRLGLSEAFDVVHHRTHIHVEYDPK